MKIFNLMLKIRNYMMQEDYKESLSRYLSIKSEEIITKQGNFQDGFLYCMKVVRDIPQKVENMKN